MKSWRDAVLSFAALPETATLLAAPDPAWIWSRDGSRVLWANPAGGARLGFIRFVELWARRWPAGHPLRREVDSLVRTLPEKGALGRLRLSDELRSVPVACRCRRVRAGEERGILVIAVDRLRGRPLLSDLAEFFSDGLAGAVIVDGTGAIVAGGAAYQEGEAGIRGHQIPFDQEGKVLRLCLPEPEGRSEDAVPPGAPPPNDAGPAIEAPEAAKTSPLPSASAVADPVPSETADQPPAPLPAKEEPRREPTTRSRTGLRAVIRGQLAPPASASAQAGAEEAAPEPPPRIISAGRVPRELSRKPVRFLWQTDGADRFLFVSPGLAQVVGRNAEIVGERWQDAASRLRLDPGARIGRALSQRDTWSGQTAWWPIEGSNVRVPVELTALPIFGIDHSFQGYRGFGVLKPAEALMPAAFDARFGVAGDSASTVAEQTPPYEEAVATAPANVVPIRADLERTADHARLTPQERTAFEEIAAALRQRVLDQPPPAEARAEPAKDREEHAPAAAESLPAEPETGASASIVELLPAPDSHQEQPALPSEPGPAGDAEDGRGTSSDQSEAEQLQPEAPLVHTAGETPILPAPELPAGTDAPDGLSEPPSREAAERHAATRAKFSESETQRRLREMTAILDTATDGVVVLDGKGTIESVNASAEALFGLEAHEMQGIDFGELLTAGTRQSAFDYLSGLKDNGVASLLNEGREVEAIAGAGSIPLFMTMGRISSEGGGRFCAVLRDITHWKRTEAELVAARRAAEAASNQKSEFLARVSHEIRTPLNAIIGFAEVMIEERFGPVENDRYREYLRDIRTSGEHVVSLVNDLLDISKIEAGKLDLNFQAVPLNELVRESIALMQPQANRAHVVLRSSLSKDVPAIVADQRTLRQIVLNLLSNSVKFTAPGGQVIASTSLAETGEALLRIRDTGEGMSEEELARALEPFRQIATAALSDGTGTGLGLPLTKALVEANRASLAIRSARGEGTVVTITFPPTRVLSE